MVLEDINQFLNYIQTNSKFYKEKLRSNSKINKLNEIKDLPFTTKDDIARQNLDFLCVDESEVRDFLTTSGTLGEPISFFLTKNDLVRLAVNERNSFDICDIRKGDKVLLTTTMDKCFMAGLAYYLGSQELGVGIIRTGPGNIKYQWDMIERFSPEVIITVPSFLLKMINFAKDQDISLEELSLKKAICIGEPIRNIDFSLNSLGKAITSTLDIRLYSTYASTEMMTAFTECNEGKGGHHQQDMIFIEVLDHNNNEVANGESGELVVTTLGVEAMPLLRYRTGDICTIYREPCNCGRDSIRLGPVLGRKSQRLKIKGTTIFPLAILEAIYAFKVIHDFVVEVNKDEFGSDNLCLFVAHKFLEVSSLKLLKNFLKSKLLFTPEIKIVDIKVINKKLETSTNRKINRFKDLR